MFARASVCQPARCCTSRCLRVCFPFASMVRPGVASCRRRKDEGGNEVDGALGAVNTAVGDPWGGGRGERRGHRGSSQLPSTRPCSPGSRGQRHELEGHAAESQQRASGLSRGELGLESGRAAVTVTQLLWLQPCILPSTRQVPAEPGASPRPTLTWASLRPSARLATSPSLQQRARVIS